MKCKSCLTPQDGQCVRKLVERPCFEATFSLDIMHNLEVSGLRLMNVLCRLQKELDFHGLERKDDPAIFCAIEHTSV
jgi:hypothetical protein